ncbi:hypothetical protein B0H13DRAFT_1851317 [Mycena leptocephala]|nr:hypothetical protein B0H13DRAFT_1851317 [Mycena leptocephala]
MNCVVPVPAFSELHPDVIFLIFARCDIDTVISVSQTCKSLYELAFTKTTWLALVVDLRRRLILGAACTPDLQDLTTEELLAIVKRLKTGPSSWGAGGAPHISKEIIVQVKMRGGGYHHAKLLRSGGHVLFHNYGALECWDVARDHLVWEYTPLVEGGEVICFAAEENGSRERLTILIYESSVAGHHPADFVKVFDLNLSTGTHDDLLVTRSPLLDTSDPIPGSGAASISGAICAVLPAPMGQYRPGSGAHDCVDGQPSPQKPYWSPAIGIGIGDLKSVFIDKISGLTLGAPKDITDFFFYVSVHVDPLRDHAYRLWAIRRRRYGVDDEDTIGLTYSGHSFIYADEDYENVAHIISSPTATSGFIELQGCSFLFTHATRQALWLKPSDGLPGRRSNDTHGSRQPRPDCIGLRVVVPGRARLCDCTPLGIMKIRRYRVRATEQWTCDAPNIYTRTPVRPPNNNLRRSIIPSLYIAVLDEGAKGRKKEKERVPRWVAGRWMAIGFPEI